MNQRYIRNVDVNGKRIGLAVAEMQTVHHGHAGLLSTMVANCDVSILALGSSDKSGVLGHPFTFEQRKEMIERIYGPLIQVVKLQDIDSSVDDSVWMGYVLDRIAKAGLPAPTDYFTGSEVDSRWYGSYFPSVGEHGVKSGTLSTYFRRVDHGDELIRRLHILDRSAVGFPTGREIRLLIERRDMEWRDHVPARLWEYVEWNYPPHLRHSLKGGVLPEDGAYPVGTRFEYEGRAVCGSDADREKYEGVFVLRDDGAWRRSRQETDEKAEAARRLHEAFENRT